MLDRSVFGAVAIDHGVVIFVDESTHVLDFVMVPWDFHELTSVPHCLSCIGIVFHS
jgi:hypothetical protein